MSIVFQFPWLKRNMKITFILASSNMGNMMKTGSIGVDKYSLPSVGEQNKHRVTNDKMERISAITIVSLSFLLSERPRDY